MKVTFNPQTHDRPLFHDGFFAGLTHDSWTANVVGYDVNVNFVPGPSYITVRTEVPATQQCAWHDVDITDDNMGMLAGISEHVANAVNAFLKTDLYSVDIYFSEYFTLYEKSHLHRV